MSHYRLLACTAAGSALLIVFTLTGVIRDHRFPGLLKLLGVWLLALLMACVLFASPAGADDGPVVSAIGAVISAMQPTSTSPDNYAHGYGDDDGDN